MPLKSSDVACTISKYYLVGKQEITGLCVWRNSLVPEYEMAGLGSVFEHQTERLRE